MDLSVLIPARREMWLKRTIEDVLAHAEAETEVIAVVDGEWPIEPLAQHPRVTVIRVPQSIGQRAATNLAARVSRAKYVMKLDAHCSVAQGFDRELIAAAADLGEDVTQIPAQTNLHVFDWVCEGCSHRTYQGPTPSACQQCGHQAHRRDIVWKPRESRRTTAWRFDTEPKFQYWRDGQKRQQGEICDVMTALGACFFMSRSRYWALGGLDEGHGSWGSYGIEIALKSWLSGGRHVVNKRTSFAHLFRTQGGDFGFPYPISGRDQERAREYARQLWFANTWPGQVRPLSWLIEHFAPLPDWHDASGAARLASVMAAGASFALRQQSGLPLGRQVPEIALVETDIAPSGAAVSCRKEPQRAEQVAPGAVCSADLERGWAQAAHQVRPGCDELQVGRIAAPRIAAQVVDDLRVSPRGARQITDQPREHDPMKKPLVAGASRKADASVATAWRAVAGPMPAAHLVHDDGAKDAGQCLSVDVANREHVHGPAILARSASAGVVYYSDCLPDTAILQASRDTIARSGLPIVAVTLKPIHWDAAMNVVLPSERGVLTMFRQILIGLRLLDTESVFLAEHDVLYAREHWHFRPPAADRYYYQMNVWKVDAESGRAVTYATKQTSQLCANRLQLIDHYRRRIARVEAEGFSRRMGFEPGSHQRPERVDDIQADTWRATVPNIDLRHGRNLTPSRWSPDQFRSARNCRGWQESETVPGWGRLLGQMDKLLKGDRAHG